jgi:hypothetical protein
MVELPTLYQWLFKIAIIVFAIAVGYIYIGVDKVFPRLKNTIIFKYIVTPLLYIAGGILVFLFIV